MSIFVAFIVVNRRWLFFYASCSDQLVVWDLFQVTVLTEMKWLWSLVLCHLQVWIEGWNSLCYFCICCVGSWGGTRCELDIWKICRVYVVVHPSTHYYPEEIERMWSTLYCSVHPTIVSLITSSKFHKKKRFLDQNDLLVLLCIVGAFWSLLVAIIWRHIQNMLLSSVFRCRRFCPSCLSQPNANLIRQLSVLQLYVKQLYRSGFCW